MLTPSARIVACRVAVIYEGTGVWSGERASHGITVSAYPASNPLPLTQEWDSPTPIPCWADSRRVPLTGLDATLELGFSSGVDDGPYGLEWQTKVATDWLDWVTYWRGQQAHLFRAAELRITALTDENRPTGLLSTRVDLSAARWAPTTNNTAGPLVALNVRMDARRRGRRGQGSMYPGPIRQLVMVSNGLLTPSVAYSVGTTMGAALTKLRTQTVPLLPVVACPVVWQRSSPLVSPVWRVRVSDELVGLSRRQTQRTNEYTVTTL